MPTQLIDRSNLSAGDPTHEVELFGCLPHGLSQFDSDDCLVFANRRFGMLYGLDAETLTPGIGREELLNQLERSDLRELLLDIVRSGDRFAENNRVWQTEAGRLIAVSCEFQPGGGYTILHEDVTSSEENRLRYQRLANEDSLTGLLNRAAFRTELVEALHTADGTSELALFYLDLDRFKPINDTLGHPVGDLVLKEVANRIRAMIRPGDLVARLGGDEFALLQCGATQPGGSRILAKRLIESIATPMQVDGHTISVGASIGVAIAPLDANQADELVKNADLALYQSKKDGMSLLRYYEPKMSEQVQCRRELEGALRKALENQEFEVLYQPVMDVSSNTIVSVEGLVRWNHPTLGRVSPDNFIPLAEESGLIVPIGEWVLHQACRDAAAMENDMRVAVNVSPVQLRNRAFVGTVIRALQAAELKPDRLELEVTETSLAADTELTIAILTELRAHGVKVAMDDFGTGYSSINYLRRFPFDKIKIDRSFVSGVAAGSDAAALVRMIAALGGSLAVTTTAEGVETMEELDMVREAGCSQIQGYFLSKPIRLNELNELLK